MLAEIFRLRMPTRSADRHTSLKMTKHLDRGPRDRSYWIELPTCEKMLLAFDPMSRMVPTTMTRTTASITEYSAMS
jgi:hypothetical protein